MKKLRNFRPSNFKNIGGGDAVLAVGTLAIVLLFAVGIPTCNKANDSVILEGYEHAWIQCETTTNTGGFLLVSNGHYKDPELNKLMKLASETCPGDNPELYSQTK